MTSLRFIWLVLSVLGNINGPFRAEARRFQRDPVGEWLSVSGQESRNWHTTEALKGHAGRSERYHFGICASGHVCSALEEYRNPIALEDTWTPADSRLWEFPAEHQHLPTSWIRFYDRKQDWKADQSEQWPHGAFTARALLLPYESDLEFSERGVGRQPIPQFSHQGTGQEPAQMAGPMGRSSGDINHFNWSGGGKRRAKRSCVLRRINRFFRRVQRFTQRGILGELIRAAGGLQGDLRFYRIQPNAAGAEGVGVAFQAGTPNWQGVLGDETNSGAGTLGLNGVRTSEATNVYPIASDRRVDSETNIGSVDAYTGE